MISYFPAILAAGAAYGGVRAGLNGARQSIVQIEKIVTRLDEKVDDHSERLIAVEIEATVVKNIVAENQAKTVIWVTEEDLKKF